MPYRSLRFDVDAGHADAWGDALLDAGALSIDIADSRAGTGDEIALYDEPGNSTSGAWAVCRLTALFAADADVDAALEDAGSRLSAVLPAVEVSAVADADWVRRTQAQFRPLRIAERLWIVPSWCEPIDPDALNITLDPGLAFGTGSHPTTQLCLEWLAHETAPGAEVLDYGCGSGILAIAAAMLGAARVVGVDVDPQAIAASQANAAANGVAVAFRNADEFAAAPDTFDLVVANILANPLRILAPALAARVRVGGRIVLSGVLGEQATSVVSAYAPWFIIDVWNQRDGWVALAGTRPATAAAR